MRKLFIILLLLMPVFVHAQFMMGEPGIILPSINGNGFQTETNTFLTAETAAGKTYTSQQQIDIDTIYRDLKGLTNPRYSTYNVISRVNIIYGFFSGVSASDKVNMVNPGTYNYTETGSPTYSTSTYSIAFNGTTQYINTTHAGNGTSTFGSSDFTFYAYHRIDNNTDGNATIGEIGGGNSYMQILTASTKVMYVSAQQAYLASNAQATARLWWAGWSSSGVCNAYYNKTKLLGTTVAFANTPTRSVLIGAFNNAVVGFGGACTVDFYIEGTGAWSDAEEASIYDCFKRARLSVLAITWN